MKLLERWLELWNPPPQKITAYGSKYLLNTWKTVCSASYGVCIISVFKIHDKIYQDKILNNFPNFFWKSLSDNIYLTKFVMANVD